MTDFGWEFFNRNTHVIRSYCCDIFFANISKEMIICFGWTDEERYEICRRVFRSETFQNKHILTQYSDRRFNIRLWAVKLFVDLFVIWAFLFFCIFSFASYAFEEFRRQTGVNSVVAVTALCWIFQASFGTV